MISPIVPQISTLSEYDLPDCYSDYFRYSSLCDMYDCFSLIGDYHNIPSYKGEGVKYLLPIIVQNRGVLVVGW